MLSASFSIHHSRRYLQRNFIHEMAGLSSLVCLEKLYDNPHPSDCPTLHVCLP
jgi:hypothetical protein